MFTRLYISEYKLNNREDVNYFEHSIFSVIVSRSGRITENGSVDIAESEIDGTKSGN